MTPKEIVNEVRKRNDEGRGCSAFSEHECSHIDHLLAIHAAVVELFEAEAAYKAQSLSGAPFEVALACIAEAQERYHIKHANLADLCGWKAEDGA